MKFYATLALISLVYLTVLVVIASGPVMYVIGAN
jgi:hypothetical protein